VCLRGTGGASSGPKAHPTRDDVAHNRNNRRSRMPIDDSGSLGQRSRPGEPMGLREPHVTAQGSAVEGRFAWLLRQDVADQAEAPAIRLSATGLCALSGRKRTETLDGRVAQEYEEGRVEQDIRRGRLAGLMGNRRWRTWQTVRNIPSGSRPVSTMG